MSPHPTNGHRDLLTQLAESRAESFPCHCDDDAEHPTASAPVDLKRIEAAVREILHAVGENPDREGLLETPARVARMYAEIFSGLHTDPAQYLKKTFTQKHDEMVLVKDIEVYSSLHHRSRVHCSN